MKPNFRRLSSGGLIDRSKKLHFQFNQREYTGFQGDTLASALITNQVDIVSRSFKYHRCRGFQGLGYSDVSSLVQLIGEESAPNALASVTPLKENLRAQSVNCWPTVNYDFGSLLESASPIIPSGFYYKTFMWPRWGLFEPSIRKLAGFGKVPNTVEARPYESRYYHCDVLVVGAGPAGLAFASSIASTKAQIVVLDDMIRPGGSLLRCPAVIGSMEALEWVDTVVSRLDSMQNVIRLQNATAWGYYEGNMVAVVERNPEPGELAGRNWKIWAKHIVLATGALERPIVFENNDRPGVMLCSAASDYINQYAVAPGTRAVVFANNDQAYRCVQDLANANIEVAAIADVRNKIPEYCEQVAKKSNIEVLPGHAVRKVHGRKRVKNVEVGPKFSKRTARRIDCDLVCVSGGWNPLVNLFSQSGGSIRYSKEIESFIPGEAIQSTHVVGAAKGIFDLAECISDGMAAGAALAAELGLKVNIEPSSFAVANSGNAYDIESFWYVENGMKQNKAFVDLAGDVTLANLKLALREGYRDIDHVKRYTTVGMGLDQGKTANVNAIGIVADELNVSIDEVGTTTFRPPYSPVEFGAIVGSRSGSSVLPYRHTPMTGWHKNANAVMYEAGSRWRRPGYYLMNSESMDDAIQRECRAVRNAIGIYDGSPLGKFELKGRDVPALLNLVYTNSYDGLNKHRGHYGVMLTEDGLVFDDGVTFRLDEEHYLMTCSTGNAPAVEAKLEKLINIDCPEMDATVIPVTSQWANATVCGPKARELMERTETDIDFSREALPFMSMCEGTMAEMPVRVFRVSFTGELSFEVNTPWWYGMQLWEYLMSLGNDLEIFPVGSEANHVLRVEKGFLSLAHEVDGTVDPIDLGMDWIVSKKKLDFIGRRAMEIRRRENPLRRELVGLLPENPDIVIPEGAPLTPGGRAGDSEGFVSASVYSVSEGRSIALGLLMEGRSRIGDTVYARARKEVIPALVTKPVFYDPDGHRLRM